jgi:Tfp pilus assembly protein PilX
MAMTHTQQRSLTGRPLRRRGFVLLIAAIFMSVMLSFGLALASISFKQQVLASTATESQYAFFAADAGLECGYYADRKNNLFNYNSHSDLVPPNPITCDGYTPAGHLTYVYDTSKKRLMVTDRIKLASDTRCVDVTVYKYQSGTTYIYSLGYDVPCDTVTSSQPGARIVMRIINSHY